MSYLGLIGLPEQCTQAFGDIFNKECGMILVSKLLGLAMIAGSVLLKVPQIQNIVSSGSVEGLAPMSFYSEVLLFVFSVIYNFQMGFPISSYGESISVLIQNIILVFLVWEYMKPPISTGKKASVASLLLLISVLAYNVPPAQRHWLVLSNLPMILVARVPQILMNLRNGHTGQLALVTTLLSAGGGAARVLTTLVESGGDLPLLVSYLVGCGLNTTLLIQIFWYSKATADFNQKAAAKKGK